MVVVVMVVEMLITFSELAATKHGRNACKETTSDRCPEGHELEKAPLIEVGKQKQVQCIPSGQHKRYTLWQCDGASRDP